MSKSDLQSTTQADPNTPGLHQIAMPTTTYTVYGNSLAEIDTQMAQCAPSINADDTYAAGTDYLLGWNIAYQNDANGMCIISAVNVTLTTAQTYPSWQSTTDGSIGLKNSWQAFMTNLSTHENGHMQLDLAAASSLYSSLQNLAPTDCSQIEAKANALAQNRVDALDQANNDYDEATSHGASQGAVLR